MASSTDFEQQVMLRAQRENISLGQAEDELLEEADISRKNELLSNHRKKKSDVDPEGTEKSSPAKDKVKSDRHSQEESEDWSEWFEIFSA